MKKYISIVILILSSLFSGGCDGQGVDKVLQHNEGLIKDILSLREERTDIKIDVTSIVKKYINLGDEPNEALEVLRRNGFDSKLLDHRAPGSDEYDKIFLATYDTRSWSDFVFGDVIEIILKVNDNSIKKISGSLIYKHL